MKNIIMEEVLDVALDENDVLEKIEDHEKKLGEHKQILDNHNDKIQGLEINTSILKEKMTNLEGIVTRFEANSYQTQNNMMQLLSQVVVNTSNSSVEILKNATTNNTEVTKIKDTNKTTVILKVVGIVGAIVCGLLAAKYGVSIPAIF